MIDIGIVDRLNIDANRTSVLILDQQVDQLSKIDHSLANTHLDRIGCGISQVNVVYVLDKFLVVGRRFVSEMIVAGVKRQAQSFDVATDYRNGIWIS